MKGPSTAALAAMLALAPPLAAQQPSPTAGAAAVPPETIVQAGAALREVTTIRETYAPQIAAAKSDAEAKSLTERAMELSTKAITDRGLSVDQYNDVMVKARSDRALGDQVLQAARSTAQ
jgi:hypothetical protein